MLVVRRQGFSWTQITAEQSRCGVPRCRFWALRRKYNCRDWAASKGCFHSSALQILMTLLVLLRSPISVQGGWWSRTIYGRVRSAILAPLLRGNGYQVTQICKKKEWIKIQKLSYKYYYIYYGIYYNLTTLDFNQNWVVRSRGIFPGMGTFENSRGANRKSQMAPWI